MRLLDAVTRGLHWISLAILVGLVLLINIDIFARNLLSRPVSGVSEIMGQAIVIFAFCQLPNSFSRGHILRNDQFLRRLENSAPRVRHWLNVAFHVLAFAVLIPLVVQTAPMLVNDYVSQDFVGAIGSFTWPVWPTRFAIMLGSIVLMAQILRCGLRDVR